MRIVHLSRILVLVVVLITGLTSASATYAQSDGTSGATPEASPASTGGLESATEWLVGQQADDGGFPGFSGETDAGTTVDAIFALIAANQSGIDTTAEIDAAVGYLESGDIALVYTQTGVGQAAKLALALSSLGSDPHNIANVDPLAIVSMGQNPDTGIYGMGPYDHALSILALSASGEDIPEMALTVLEDFQAENGGWGFDGSTDDAAVDSNTTSMVIQALAASGLPDSGMIESGLGYLESTLREGAGAANNDDPASLADSNSTALVAQAVIATGGDAASEEWQDLLAALISFQNADGSLGYQADVSDPNLLSTVQGIPALAGVAFPIPAGSNDSATPVGFIDPWTWQAAA